MNGQSNLPRRAWQRQNVQRNRATIDLVSNQAIERATYSDSTLPTRTQQLDSNKQCSVQRRTHVNSGCDSQCDDIGHTECHTSKSIATALPKPRPRTRRHYDSDTASESDSGSDINEDSGYCSPAEDELYEQFQADGPTLANHGDKTKQFKQTEEKKWIRYVFLNRTKCYEDAYGLFDRFCERRNDNPTEALRRCDAVLFKVYLDSRVKNSRIQKESTVMTYWKVLSMIYAERATTWMGDHTLFDIRNVSVRYPCCVVDN